MFQPFSNYSQYSYNDPDALTFISASAITNLTQKTAINQITIDLKSYGIWNKTKAIYPFVGGTAATHKWNLKDTRDIDAAFRLNFFGSMTHNSNGITGNASNALALTYIIPSSSLTLNSTSITLYSRTNESRQAIDVGVGADQGITPERLGVSLRWPDPAPGGFYSDQYNYNTGRVGVSNSSSIGMFTSNRSASNVHKAYRNGIQVGTTNTGSAGVLTNLSVPIAIMALYRKDNSAGAWYAAKNIAFAHIGDGLTDTEVSNLYDAVQRSQIILNRQI